MVIYVKISDEPVEECFYVEVVDTDSGYVEDSDWFEYGDSAFKARLCAEASAADLAKSWGAEDIVRNF